MTEEFQITSDVAFTPTVKAIQSRKGSRATYSKLEAGAGWKTTITPDLAALLAEQTSVFLGTANAASQPYIQHRGGPPGFLRVLNDKTVAFVDFRGNRQFITQGNLAENPKAHLFLMNYAQRQRVKIWGAARVLEDDAVLVKQLMPADYKARGDQVIMFTVHAWDSNCPQHIPQRFDAADVAKLLETRDQRIAELEAKLARLSANPTR